MFDTVGSRLNFPVVAGVAETFRVSFFVGGEGMSVAGATFQAGCYAAHGDERGELVAVLPVEHDSKENAVRLSVPELDEGHYWWELRATDAVGKEARLLYGTLSALTSAEVARLGDEADASELRELSVEVGGGYAKPLILRWQACSVAGSLAAEAARYAERAEAAAGRAEAAQDDVLGKLAAAQAFMESFNRALFEAIRVIDGYLWVGGVSTGHFLKGNDGITPHIGTDGFWYVGSLRLGDRPAFGQDGITPHITPDGFWAFGEYKTGVRAAGRDGIDGAAVRRILADSYDDIPQEGDLCHGGVLFYVPAGVERCERLVSSVPSGAAVSNYNLDGVMIFSSGRTWVRRGGALRRLGVMAGSTVSGGEPSEEALYAHVFYESGGEWVYAGHSSNAVAQIVNTVSWWDFDELEPAPGECRVKLVMSRGVQEPADEQAERVRVQVVGVVATEGSKVGDASYCAWAYWVFRTQELQAYDVYAWVESPEVGGAWVRVDENYDLATAEVYGLMKYATDMPVAGGAPVGRNLDGQACVPIADVAMPGAMSPSSSASQNAGGLTHVGEDKRLYVDMATPSVPGVGKTSYTRVTENTNSVGLTADGRFSVPRAAAFQWGVSKVGTSVPQSNGMPWIIPVGAAEDGVHNEYGQDITGQLMNNVLVGGALRTALKNTWLSWAPNGIDVDVLPDNCNAVGIMTSRSFSQSAAEGLVLEAATESLLGGVRILHTIGSGSPGHVPTANAVKVWCNANFYTKSQTYSRSQTYNRSEVEAIDGKNRVDAAATYKTIESAKSEHDGLEREIEGCVKKTASWNGEVYLTLSEYQALKVRDPKIAYNILED